MKSISFLTTKLPCEGIIFDKDGTLIDIFSMLKVLGNERYKHLCEEVDQDSLRYYGKCTGYDPKSGSLEAFGPLASAKRRDEVAVAACALWLGGIPWFRAYELAKDAYDKADETLDPSKGVELLPGVEPVLRSLSESGIPLFVVTSDSHDRAERILSHLGLRGLFHLVIGADDVKETKPSPEGILLCAQRIGADPKNLIVIGDAPQDGLMAKNTQSRSIGVLTGVGAKDTLLEYFDYVLEGVKDIRPSQ